METELRQQKKRVDFDLSDFTEDERAEMDKMYEESIKNFSEGSIVPGKVLEVRDTEVLVDIGYKSEGVIPADEFDDMSQVNPGDPVDVLLEDMEDQEGMVVLSKRRAEQKLKWERVLSILSEDSVVEGLVKSRVKGGLMVDVEGVGAFLPGSQIDTMPVRDTGIYLGKKFEFKILKIDARRRNIVVSRRELIQEDMERKKKDLLTTIAVGQWRKGMAKNITDFGVFVDLDGIDGLLHITDMSWGRIKHPSELVSVGQELEVVILDVDLEKERVSLGLKQKSANPWEDVDKKYPVGSRLKGRVVNLVPYGAFVELEQGVEGLVHVSEISWTRRISRASDVLAIADMVDVVVLTISKEEKKIALGIRQTVENPWDGARERYPVGSRVTGKVRNFTSYGAFIELEDGLEGMIHVSDMSWTRKVNHPSEVLDKDAAIEAVILEVDSDNQRISLGLKQAQDDPWSSIGQRYRIGQLVKGKVTKVAAFGAFIEIEEGVDGLVHVSQISEDRVEKVGDVLDIGQEVEARVVRIDAAERRIGLSIKAINVPEEDFMQQTGDMFEGLKPGEDLVDLAGAFDEAYGASNAKQAVEEWHPGDKGDSDNEDGNN